MPTHPNPCGAATTWVVWGNTWKTCGYTFLALFFGSRRARTSGPIMTICTSYDVVPTRVKQIQDGRRPSSWKSIIGHISGTVRPIFAKFGSMTHIGPQNPTGSWNFQLLKIQDGGRPPSWKIEIGHRTISVNAEACSCQKCHTPSRQK